MNKIYAGIGSRETPPNVLSSMTAVAYYLGKHDWMLRSGAANGADSAFELGAPPQLKEIHLPWNGYNGRYTRDNAYTIVPDFTPEVEKFAAAHHPAWPKLGRPVRAFMNRNTTIILGCDLKSPVDMIICWTKGGRIDGGTGHALRLAQTFKIPVFNLAIPADAEALAEFVN